MAEKYIDKVLSHLKNQKHKNDIMNELSDHILLHQEFFEEIGYDEEASELKAEEKMGDADIVGEQFCELEKERGQKSVFINIFAISVLVLDSFYLLLCAYQDGISFVKYAACNFLFIISLVLIYFSFKKRYIFPLLTGIVNSVYVIFSDYNPAYFIVDFFTEKSAYHELLGIMDGIALYENYDISGYYLRIMLAAFLILAAIFSIIYSIRIKLLKNSKPELIFKKIFSILIIMLIAIIVPVFTFNAYMVKNALDSGTVKNEQQTQILYYDKIIANNIESINGGDVKALYSLLQNIIADNEKEDELEAVRHIFLNDYIQLFANVSILYPDKDFMDFSITSNLIDVNGKYEATCSNEELKLLSELSDYGNIKLSDIKIPYNIYYEFNRDNNKNPVLTLVFKTNCDYYDSYIDNKTDYIIFEIENGKAIYKESCFESVVGSNNYTTPVSSEQLSAINTAIKNYSQRQIETDNNRYDLKIDDDFYFQGANKNGGKGLSLGEVNKRYCKLYAQTSVNILDIHEEGNEYYADVIIYDDIYTIIDKKLFDFGLIISPFSYKFRIDDLNVNITEEWYPNKTEDEEALAVKHFSTIGRNRFKNMSYIDNTLSELTFIESIETSSHQNLYGIIDNVYDNGEYTYREYDIYHQPLEAQHTGKFKN